MASVSISRLGLNALAASLLAGFSALAVAVDPPPGNGPREFVFDVSYFTDCGSGASVTTHYTNRVDHRAGEDDSKSTRSFMSWGCRYNGWRIVGRGAYRAEYRVEFNCAKRLLGTIRVTIWDADDHDAVADRWSNAGMHEVAPGTMDAVLLKIACGIRHP